MTKSIKKDDTICIFNQRKGENDIMVMCGGKKDENTYDLANFEENKFITGTKDELRKYVEKDDDPKHRKAHILEKIFEGLDQQ